MPQMKNLDIDFISLVNKGANKQTVKIYKADKEPVNSEDEEFRGFFNIMKSFFTKEKKENVNKSAYITDFNTLIGEAVMEQRIRDARWALMDSLENTLLDSTIADKASHMASQIDAFKAYIINTVNTVGIQKSIEQIQQVKKSKEEDDDMKAEDIKKMLDDALAPLKEELKVLKGEEETPATEGEEGTEGEEAPKEPTQEEVIAKAIADATASLKEEITELKKSRRAPQSLDTGVEGKEVKKSYIGAFEGMFK